MKKDFLTALAAVRADIDKTRAERVRVANLPCSRAEAVERIEALVAELAAAWAPGGLGRVMAPTYRRGVALIDERPAQLASMVARIAGPALVAELVAEVDRTLGGQVTITASDRAARLEQLDAAIEGLEVREETLIREAADAGHDIDRRPDAPPAIVLAAAL